MSKFNEYLYDQKASQEVYEKMSRYIETKHCYNNIFYVVSYYSERFSSGEWKVAYGYMPSVSNIAVRHCFIVNEEDRVIDPTRYAVDKKLGTRYNADSPYSTFKVYESVDEYLEDLERNDRYPDMTKVLIDLQNEFHEYNEKNRRYMLTG